MEGKLKKWTNLLSGWKDRYFVLTDDILTYYYEKVTLANLGRKKNRKGSFRNLINNINSLGSIENYYKYWYF